jgi:hypothetical protein
VSADVAFRLFRDNQGRLRPGCSRCDPTGEPRCGGVLVRIRSVASGYGFLCWFLSSFAAPETQLLNGVPFWPATCCLLIAVQAVLGDVVEPLASFAIAVTHWLKGVPFWPATCCLLWFWQ